MKRTCHSAALALAAFALLAADPAQAWGSGSQRLIAGKAIDSLPDELRAFYDASRQQVHQGVTAPFDLAARTPAEKKNQFIYLDRYGRFPFEALPRNYNAAVRKHTKRILDANGLLPWQIGVYSEKLTNAFKARNWDEVRQYSALLAFYVAQAHDPFATTENFDGRLSNQAGADVRFASHLPERYAQFFFLRPNDPEAVHDPTDHAFEICLSAHSWLENVLLADHRARRGLVDYTDEFYDRFYNQAGAILIRQMSDAATAVASYWLTAWHNAGRPPLPQR
jgi:hypothetical protein